MPAVPGDFSFLNDDLRRQREIAREALEAAKRIDELLKVTTTIELSSKEKLEDAKKTLLSVASQLAENATHTSSLATITFSGAGSLGVTQK
jgi:hypothetical protein